MGLHKVCQKASLILAEAGQEDLAFELLEVCEAAHAQYDKLKKAKLVYTAGYANLEPEDIQAWGKVVVVVDVRLTPWSNKAGFSKRELEEALGNRYIHIPELGNVSHHTGGEIEIKSLEEGIAKLPEGPILLLCGCKNVSTCHRAVVARVLVGRDYTWLK